RIVERVLLLRFLHDDECGDARSLDLVRDADDCRLGHRAVIDEYGLLLHRADAMSGDIHHIVHAAEQPEVTVIVLPRAVAGEVDVGPFRPVLLHIAIGVAPDPAKHRWPWGCDGEIAAAG